MEGKEPETLSPLADDEGVFESASPFAYPAQGP